MICFRNAQSKRHGKSSNDFDRWLILAGKRVSSSSSSSQMPKHLKNYSMHSLIPSSSIKNLIAHQYSSFSHVDADGKASMVDVSKKVSSDRCARASGMIRVGAHVAELINRNSMKKGDVLLVAKLAGVMAAKKTSDLIPLCHPLSLTHIEVNLSLRQIGERHFVVINSEVRCSGKTGVEMEALTAVSVAALTVYDMCKAAVSADELQIEEIELVHKAGGKSGDYFRKN